MNFTELIDARAELFREIHRQQLAIKAEYEPKIAVLNLQIDREHQKGIKKGSTYRIPGDLTKQGENSTL